MRNAEFWIIFRENTNKTFEYIARLRASGRTKRGFARETGRISDADPTKRDV